MAAWVRCSRGRLVYTGRITRGPFIAWSQTAEGHAAVKQVAARIRFSFLGKMRAAARRLWRQLAATAADPAVVDAIEREVQAYLQRLGQLAFAEGLPRCGVDLRRLIVVPTVLLNGAACTALAKRLNRQPAWASLDGGDALRDFFVTTLVSDMAAAVERARPAPRGPLAADADWTTVGLDIAFVWRVPVFQAPPWNGHHYVLELPRDRITRAMQKTVAARIGGFEGSLPSLSRAERHEILRRALDAHGR
jgi:hypothetical protein